MQIGKRQDPADVSTHTGQVDVPSRRDGVVAAASEVVGGPAGVHLAARTRRGLIGTGLLGAAPLLSLGCCVTVGLALLLRQHCRATGWRSPGEFVHACYSDVPMLVASNGAASQPPGTALLLRLLAVVSSSGLPRQVPAFDASVILAAVALIVATCALVAACAPQRWDAALVALSPVVVVAGLVSVDLVAVAALAGALLAWRRRHPLIAGILLGVAASIRPAVAIALLAVWLGVLVREPRPAAGDSAGGREILDVSPTAADPDEAAGLGERSGLGEQTERASRASSPPAVWAAAMTTVGAVAAGSVVTVLAGIASPGLSGGSRWLVLNAGAGYGSLWLLPSLAGRTLAPGAVELLTALALVVVVLAGTAAAARTAQTAPDGCASVPVVALVLVAGALAFGPAVPVQATLVVAPLAVVAIPRWRDHLVWAGAEVVYATVTWLYLYEVASPDHRGAPPWMYAVVLVARLAALGWLAVAAVRRTVPALLPARSHLPPPGLPAGHLLPRTGLWTDEHADGPALGAR